MSRVVPGSSVQNPVDAADAVVVVDGSSGKPVNGAGAGVSVSFTRPNDTSAYTANDVLGSATGTTAALRFSNLRPGGAGEYLITSTTLEIDLAAIPSGMTTFELALYNVTPPSALGDNAAWDVPSGDRSAYLGRIQLGAPVDLGSTLHVSADGINKQITLTGTDVFAYLTTDAGYTPAAQTVYKVALHGLPV